MREVAHETELTLLTIAEACRRLGCARSTFYELCAADLIKLRKLGASSRVRSDDLDALIANLPVATVKPRERR